ncbi:MAG: formylglycine-generating enzyme family protein [Thermoanaerobaculia bacterium]
MSTRLTTLAMSTLACLLLAPSLRAQTVTNVRAKQLTDGTKRVEILYDLTGAAAEGATVSVAVSSDGGATYATAPSAGSLAGHVGAGVASGANRRIVWDPAAQVPAGTYGTSYRAAVTATNPSSGGQEITYTLPGGVPLVLVRIPAGTFQMGAPESERSSYDGERPVHQVTLTSDYYIGKYEVTQAQWQAVMGTAIGADCGTGGEGGNYPGNCVSWTDIRGENGFIAKLNQLLGTTKFRLPTEAEWELAARGGTQTRFSFGDALDGDDECGATAADPYVWWCANSEGSPPPVGTPPPVGWPHPVGTKAANPYGLFDMHGNMAEWVEDWWGGYSVGAQTNPTGPTTGSDRVIRGGSFDNYLRYTRSATRYGSDPRWGNITNGFRLARSL